jgi:ribose transport system permease protein
VSEQSGPDGASSQNPGSLTRATDATSTEAPGSLTPPPSRGAEKTGLQKVMSGSVGRNLGLVLALLVLVVVGAITAGESFTTFSNALVILRQASIIGVISIGMTLVIIAGGIDLSVGSVMGLASIVATLAAVQDLVDQTHWIFMVLIALAVGLGAGLINGVVIAYGKVVAFMATLAMLVAARGLAEILAERRTLIVQDRGFISFMNSDFIGVDILIWIFAIVAALGWVLLNRTTFGRRTVAIGGNREAARLAGINVKRHTMWLYAIAGLSAGIAGVSSTSSTRSPPSWSAVRCWSAGAARSRAPSSAS